MESGPIRQKLHRRSGLLCTGDLQASSGVDDCKKLELPISKQAVAEDKKCLAHSAFSEDMMVLHT